MKSALCVFGLTVLAASPALAGSCDFPLKFEEGLSDLALWQAVLGSSTNIPYLPRRTIIDQWRFQIRARIEPLMRQVEEIAKDDASWISMKDALEANLARPMNDSQVFAAIAATIAGNGQSYYFKREALVYSGVISVPEADSLISRGVIDYGNIVPRTN